MVLENRRQGQGAPVDLSAPAAASAIAVSAATLTLQVAQERLIFPLPELLEVILVLLNYPQEPLRL